MTGITELTLGQVAELIGRLRQFNDVLTATFNGDRDQPIPFAPAELEVEREEAQITPLPVAKRAYKRRIGPETHRLRKMQGQYMGYVRRLTVGEKSKVKALRLKKGLRAAIALAKRFGK